MAIKAPGPGAWLNSRLLPPPFVPAMIDNRRMIKIWDPFVRLAHWALVAGFFVAYLTEDDVLILHVWAGYLVGGIVALRTLWGLVGPRRARFVDFVYPPRAVAAYLGDLMLFRARRYLGHSPAGGAMAVALLLSLAATVGTGLMAYAVEEGKGPLAGLIAAAPSAPELAQPARADEDRKVKRAGEKKRKSKAGKAWEEAHEVLAELTFWLVVLHVLGVLWASIAHRENLVRAMIDGEKRADAALDR
jgi:cytochrome b